MTSGRQSDVRGTQGHDGHDSMGEPRVDQDPALAMYVMYGRLLDRLEKKETDLR